ncbi:hypothetical protein GRAN_3041 [Granulicella sibirica]|uniref:Uncharacterized protein n=1 Tax=Granulicella sibirica TaxID=2479048 RepID=A0A4V1L5L5_9BACT|nr:hypothetical protein GRAN_3041 [Granulicella sibirica]
MSNETDLQHAASAEGGVPTTTAALVRPLPKSLLVQKPCASAASI